jgi:hypothetical protein
MPFIGNKPSAVPLTSADIADGIITSAKIVDATITNSDVASSIITGQTAETSIAGGDSVLIYDDSASALRKMTRTNFVSGIGATAGQVIQVVTATDSTERNSTSTSFVTASNTLSVTITPSSASNKILLFFNGFCGMGAGNATDAYATIFRGATDLGAASNKGLASMNDAAGVYAPMSIHFLDSPSTTSATTYQVYARQSSGGNFKFNLGNCKSSITALEIKG